MRRDERGFTIIEAMMAAFVVAVGLLGTVTLIDVAHRETTTSKAREQAVSLQREILETARSIPYEEMLPSTIVDRVQGHPGLGDSSTESGWTIRRRGVTYTISLGVCSVDDAKDGTGAHEAGFFCADGGGGTECTQLLPADGSLGLLAGATTSSASIAHCGIDADANGQVDGLVNAEAGLCLLGTCTDDTPDDYKKLVTAIRWDRGTGARYAVQRGLVVNPGAAAGPGIKSMTGPTEIVDGTSATYTVETTRPPATVEWSVDGSQLGVATGSDTTWTFTWSLAGVVDGVYTVSARATDRHGVSGGVYPKTVRVNRSAPAAPKGFAAGRNGSVVELEWLRSSEGDIEQYVVYRVGATSDVEVCRTTRISCQDTNPPAADTSYYVVAVDRDPAGQQREGARSDVRTVTSTNNPPYPPTGLAASSSNGDTVLVWSAPVPADPDVGDTVAFYRIYRDGLTFADRYGRTGSGTELTFTDTDTGGQQHTYHVTAVDQQLAESPAAGPVTK